MALALSAVDLADSEARFRDTDANTTASYPYGAARLTADHACRRMSALVRLRSARRFADADKEPACILPGLYIGSIGAARNIKALKRLGVSHVVNASPVVPCFHRHAFKYKTVTVYDDAEDDIAAHFQSTNEFISEARQAGGTLVHCYAGRSRSATLILAYLVACEGMSLTDAYSLLLAARPCAAPNAGFQQQLHAFCQSS